ncbi:DUF1853 family protein, partial [Photobacterium japonica]|uniref:DUF1853 family protein n=1 Tax=Photobacterium japonica TaxID=2910235 RepID=UPI003D0EFF44
MDEKSGDTVIQTPSHMALPPCLRTYFDAVLTLPPLLAGSSLIADKAWLDAFRQRAVLPLSLRYEGNTRLGFFYQWLWAQLIHHHPDYDLVAEEIQLHVDGKTLGAIDFLVANRRSGELEHWEVAIKFYLAWEKSWPGPNAKDNLDKKAHRMQSHQLQLSETPAYHQQCTSRFGQPTVKRLIMQGRLFEPIHGDGTGSAIATNPTAYRGHWCYAADSTE